MKLQDFDYDLPPEYIAQSPRVPRDSAKFMLLNRVTGEVQHRMFRNIVDFIHAGDILVLNDTRVMCARVKAIKIETGGRVEVLLLRALDDYRWQALVGGRRIHPNLMLRIPETDIQITVGERINETAREVMFSQPIQPHLNQVGQIPLPPYIKSSLADHEQYQTVYSQHLGSAAAPTAGLHFTHDLLVQLRDQGVQFAYCTLHVGLGTFLPVRVEHIESHQMHSEWAQLSQESARQINQAKASGKRVIAVGTTSVRVLETAAILSEGGDPKFPNKRATTSIANTVTAFTCDTELFIFPGYPWRMVDAVITNFHLPKSTLLMMLSAFVGRDALMHAYDMAKREDYRFFSFGDAMLIS